MTNRNGATLWSSKTVPDHRNTSCDSTHGKRMAALGELASGVTHDFRNILQTVIATLDLLETRSNDPAEVRRLAGAALRASERGISLTKRLLTFSHYTTTDFRPTRLISSLESVTETLAHTVGARVNVQVDPPASDLWDAVLDPSEFELTLLNLGINARDAMPEGGRIRLGARNVTIPLTDRRAARAVERSEPVDQRGPGLALPSGDYIAITVGDTGVGMDAVTLSRAIEPFFTTKPVGKGTGLGLSLAHTLATRAGGALRLKSQPGRGTTVELWLPRAPSLPPAFTNSTIPAAAGLYWRELTSVDGHLAQPRADWVAGAALLLT
jgi:signal transduction histidine kinase